MQRRFIINLALLILINLVVKPFWVFGIDLGVQKAVGNEHYGLYYALFNFSFLFSIILDAGITNYNNRNIARHHYLLNKHLSNILIIKGLLSILYFAAMLAWAMAVGYRDSEINLLLILGLNQVLNSLVLYLRSNVGGLQLFKTDSLLSVMDKLIMILVCAPLLWGNFAGPFRIEWFIYAQTFAFVVTAAIGVVIVLRQTGKIRFTWNYPLLLSIVRHSYPFAILIVLMTIYNKVDSVMIERLLPDGKYHAGIYASAYRLLDALMMFAFLFASLLLPMFSRMLKQKEPVAPLIGLSVSLLVIPSIIFCTSCFFFREEIMLLLYGRHSSAYAVEVFGLLIFTFIAVSSNFIFGTLLTANGNLRVLNAFAFCSVVLNIILNLLLIPVYQAKGAVIAALITQGLSAFAQMIYAVYIFKLKINPLKMLYFTIFVGSLIAVNIFLKNQAGALWIASFLTVMILSLFTAYIMRLIPVVSIIRTFKKELNKQPD